VSERKLLFRTDEPHRVLADDVAAAKHREADGARNPWAHAALTRRAVVWSLGYVVLIERLLATALSGLAQWSPSWEARAVYARLGRAWSLEERGQSAGVASI